jgi:hypothetical protein
VFLLHSSEKKERENIKERKEEEEEKKQNLNTEKKFGRSVVLVSPVSLVRIAVPTFHSCCLVITIGSGHI